MNIVRTVQPTLLRPRSNPFTPDRISYSCAPRTSQEGGGETRKGLETDKRQGGSKKDQGEVQGRLGKKRMDLRSQQEGLSMLILSLSTGYLATALYTK